MGGGLSAGDAADGCVGHELINGSELVYSDLG